MLWRSPTKPPPPDIEMFRVDAHRINLGCTEILTDLPRQSTWELRDGRRRAAPILG